MESGFFFCGDILGFSNIVENLNESELDKKIGLWTVLVKAAAENHKIERFQLISDTVFAVVSDKNQLQNLINFARELLNKGIAQSIPVRGAITHGQFQWGELVYGRAVIRAHSLEQEQNWIGVAIDSNILTPQDYLDMNLVCYPVPKTSSAVIKLYAAISWDVPPCGELIKKMSSGGLSQKNETLKWKFAEKLANTIHFRIYLILREKENAPAHVYFGAHPIQLIEMELEKSLSKTT